MAKENREEMVQNIEFAPEEIEKATKETEKAEKEKEQQEKDRKLLKRLKVHTIIQYILIIILFILLFLMRCTCGSDMKKGTINMEQPKSRADLQKDVDESVLNGMFNVFMNTTPVFEDGKSKGNLLIQNVETNKAPVIVEIYNKVDNKLIYKSDELPAGYKIEQGRLLMDLDKGIYDCVARFRVLDAETKETKNIIGLNVTITVKN